MFDAAQKRFIAWVIRSCIIELEKHKNTQTARRILVNKYLKYERKPND